LIDENGENVGVVETSEALKMAQEKGLDLIEIAPNVKPPVCKILSWSKFKYELTKKKKESSHSKSKEQKEMRFSPYISIGDIEHKVKRVLEFLDKKHPVKLTIRGKGRITRDAVTEALNKVLQHLEGKYETDERPVFQGMFLSLLIYPKKNDKKE